jgi:23S rRNA (uracil1939-C5)-methyltransferase
MASPVETLQLAVHPRIKFKGDGSGEVESLNYDGRGVAHINGKTTFIENALPGEQVEYGITRKKPTFDNAIATRIQRVSPDRVIEPKCKYFGNCGGCAIQHIRDEAQIGFKQQIVAEQLKHIGGIETDAWEAPLTGPYWGYRRRARLGARLVTKKGGVLVGFREKASTYIADMNGCEILDERVAVLIPIMKELIGRLSVPDQVPQIEVAAADNAVALVFRHLKPLNDQDLALLKQFGHEHNMQVWLQPAGPDSIAPLGDTEPEPLFYGFDDSEIKIQFGPIDFTQVNAAINRKMVTRAIQWLDVDEQSQVLDLFCGLGNFSLPIAEKVAWVTGIEGNQKLVDGATANAERNGLKNVDFRVANLYEQTDTFSWGDRQYNRVVLDPPRSGAIEVIKLLPDEFAEKLVYVSCYPGTLARDAAYLVQTAGFRLSKIAVMDMFPQTTHVETMALFERV